MRTFGNLETSIPVSAAEEAGLLPDSDVRVMISSVSGTVYDSLVPYRPSFGWVPQGEEVVYNGSDGVLGIGINLGSFAEKYGIDPYDQLTVTVAKEQ